MPLNKKKIKWEEREATIKNEVSVAIMPNAH